MNTNKDYQFNFYFVIFIGSVLLRMHQAIVKDTKKKVMNWIQNRTSLLVGALISNRTFRRYEKEADGIGDDDVH